jgi:hypothetical protein
MARMTKAERDELLDWIQYHRCCAVCWWPESDGRRHLEVHHLQGGPARKHDIRQYVRLCDRCHDVLHDGSVAGNFPPLYKGTLLWAKQQSDPENYDPEYLASLRRKRHLGYEPEPPDEWYLKEREINLTRARKP